jgi:hypothetical protein
VRRCLEKGLDCGSGFFLHRELLSGSLGSEHASAVDTASVIHSLGSSYSAPSSSALEIFSQYLLNPLRYGRYRA